MCKRNMGFMSSNPKLLEQMQEKRPLQLKHIQKYLKNICAHLVNISSYFSAII